VVGEIGAILVPPGDAERLAAAVLTFAADEELRRSVGTAGRTRFEAEFAVEGMCSRVEEYFRKFVPAGEVCRGEA
jgi:glycosyltransferase involved in cell wall biosynthesis